MNCNIRAVPCRAVKEQFKLSQKRDVVWRMVTLQNEESAVGAIKVYSGNYQTFLVAHSV